MKALNRQALAKRFLLPLDRMLRGAVVHAREGLTDPNPVNVQGTRSLISAYVLKLPAGVPRHRGVIGDYLPAWDFTVVFTNIDDGKIKYRVVRDVRYPYWWYWYYSWLSSTSNVASTAPFFFVNGNSDKYSSVASLRLAMASSTVLP